MASSLKTTEYKAFLKKSVLINNGLINGICNALIFYFMHHSDQTKSIVPSQILFDYALTALILSLILIPCVEFPLRSALKKGKIQNLPSKDRERAITKWIPSRFWLQLLAVSAVTCIFFAALTYVTICFSGSLPIITATVLKGVFCTLCGGLVSYLIITTVCTRFKGQGSVRCSSKTIAGA